MSQEPMFRESQHFNRALLAPLLLITLVPGVALLVLYFRGQIEPSALLVTLFGPAVVLVVMWMRLITEVDSSGIRVRLYPFPGKRFTFHQIARAYSRTYRPLLEYGGWGIRWGWSGTAYNARGNRGVQLELLDGKRVLIGSQRSDDLLAAIRTAAPWVLGQPVAQAV